MAFRVAAVTAMLCVSCVSLQAMPSDQAVTTSVAKCELSFEVVYSEEADPYPICFHHCPAEEEVWYDGVAFKRLCELDRHNLMIEATFNNGELQGCKMVPLATNEVLKARQDEERKNLNDCLARNAEESSSSSITDVESVSASLNGFTPVGSSFYMVTPREMSWRDGSNLCRQMGATPAIIESQEEQELLQEMLTTDVWIGLNDVEREGSFTNPGRSAVHYTNWADGQPNNGFGQNEDCTMMVGRLEHSWIDANCDIQRRVLCELLASPVESDVFSEAGFTDNGVEDTTAPELRTATQPPTTTTTTTPIPTTTTTTTPPTTTTERVPVLSCPSQSHMYRNSACFHVSGANVKGDYSQAKAYCASRGMTLASIHSAEEQSFVRRLLTDSVWIGLHDPGHRNVFRWIDGTPLDYSHFPRGQPDAGLSEYCVEIRASFGFHWNNWQCRQKIQFLCKTAVIKQ